jgi:hypothetical protein
MSDYRTYNVDYVEALTARCEAVERLLGEILKADNQFHKEGITQEEKIMWASVWAGAKESARAHLANATPAVHPDTAKVKCKVCGKVLMGHLTVLDGDDYVHVLCYGKSPAPAPHPDTVRLEWLEKHIMGGFNPKPHIEIFYGYDSDHLMGFMIIDALASSATRRRVITGGHDTFRAAIDAAIKEAGS